MADWEYLVALMPVNLSALTYEGESIPAVDTLGAEGWELVALLPTTRPDAPAAGFFKREAGTGPLPPQTATLTELVPDTVQLGAPSFTLRVLGSGFTPDSVIVWNGSDEVTTFVDEFEVTTAVNMATAEVAVTVGIEVRNGALVSNLLPFTFTAA